jgi:hypothetical protein
MSRIGVPENRSSRADRPRPRWRPVLAALVVAGMAALGVGGVGGVGPAAAAEGDPLTVTVTDCGYFESGRIDYAFNATNTFTDKLIALLNAEGLAIQQVPFGTAVTGTGGFDVAPGSYSIVLVESLGQIGGIMAQVPATVGACADLGVSVEVTSCSTDRSGSILLTLSELVAGGIVTYDVEGPDFSTGGSLDEYGTTEVLDLADMPPGNYYALAEWHPIAGGAQPPALVFDWVGFAVAPCQPAMQLAVTPTGADGTGGVDVTLSSLVNGVDYRVWVTDAGDPDGTSFGAPQAVTGDATGTAALGFGSLPGGHVVTVWVEGTWEGTWEEPPFLGNGGNFAPLESVTLATSADASVAPAPAVVAEPTGTPAATATSTLPDTGPDGLAGSVLAAVALLGLGAALRMRRLPRAAGRSRT